MATLVLGAIGTLVGGPIGGAIGATLGRGLDSTIIGSPRREGPRLKELAISTSSYGRPIPAVYGMARVPGTVVWATDLKEDRETSGGGKGKPKTTTYNYSVSLALALSSRPIRSVGRIWADGHLLRGSAGDLKTAGTLRVHTGDADQMPDPLLAAANGSRCPAYRGCAYVVFEDLALEDFGNRIPALSFEIFADPATRIVDEIAQKQGLSSRQADFPELQGFVHDSGSPAAVLSLINRLKPLTAVPSDRGTRIEGTARASGEVPLLPPASAWGEGDFGRESGATLARASSPDQVPSALRYYDPSRAYQPGLQRADAWPAGQSTRPVLEFPGILSATDARTLLARASVRARQDGETLAWRTSELDPGIGPGSIVRVPDLAGLWRFGAREWREGGIEFELVRHVAPSTASQAADPGQGWSAPDRPAVTTSLRVFELPWDGSGSSEISRRFAAVSAPDGRWSGAALYRTSGDGMVPLAQSGPVRAVGGTLIDTLPPSNALRLERSASCRVALLDDSAELEPVTADALARGANRLLIGDEIVQFGECEAEGDGVWRLTGLLRGRGGSEIEAACGHPAGTSVTLLDERLVDLPEGTNLGDSDEIAAIGFADSDPVVATLENPGRTRRPLFPVQPRWTPDGAGGVVLGWTRRARGGWAWLDEVEQPLVEQVERYEVGLGEPENPIRLWDVTEPRLALPASEIAALRALAPGASLWVRQKGSFAVSAPLHLTILSQSTDRIAP